MIFSYGYKTKENEVREGTIAASSRDGAYRKLKELGIKPFRVELAHGTFNWLASLGKRTYAILALCALCSALCVVLFRTRHEARSTSYSPQPRHQIYGDPALMAELERDDFAAVFTHPGDRVLACYAQPGQKVPRASDSAPKAQAKALADLMCSSPNLFAARGAPHEAREIIELKRIVLGMRGELRRYLANGIGTPERYILRLNERQAREAMIYSNALRELEGETDPAKWEQVNDSLRAIGIKTIPMPE